MAKFREGQKIRVPDHNPGASSLLWGRVGTVAFVVPPLGSLGKDQFDHPVEGPVEGPVEQLYIVRFDGENVNRNVSESRLEPAD